MNIGKVVVLSFVFLVLDHSVLAQTGFHCKEIDVKAMSEEAPEKELVCTMIDPSYFISENCQDLNCGLIDKLKTERLPHHTSIRLGAAICHTLKGEQEEVQFENLIAPERRCYFPEDKTFISFNLLESWDGNGFRGPKTLSLSAFSSGSRAWP